MFREAVKSPFELLMSIETAIMSVFFGVSVMVASVFGIAAMQRAQQSGIDKSVTVLEMLSCLGPFLATQLALMMVSDDLRSPFTVLPPHSTWVHEATIAVLCGALASALALCSALVLCYVYGEAYWQFDFAHFQLTLITAFITLPLEEIGWRNYAFARLKVHFHSFAASVIVGAVSAATSLPLFWFQSPWAVRENDRFVQLFYWLMGSIALSCLVGMVHEKFDDSLVAAVSFRAFHAAMLASLGLPQLGSYMLVFSQVGLLAYAVLRPSFFRPDPTGTKVTGSMQGAKLD